MKYCPNCGGQMEDTATFCLNCGANAAAPQAPQAPVDPVAPQAPYGQPAYYAAAQVPYGQPAKVPGKGLGIAGMVLGIVSLALFCFWYLAIPCVITGCILAGIGLNQAKKVGAKNGMAVAGLVCSLIALAILVVIVVIGVIAVEEATSSYYYYY